MVWEKAIFKEIENFEDSSNFLKSSMCCGEYIQNLTMTVDILSSRGRVHVERMVRQSGN